MKKRPIGVWSISAFLLFVLLTDIHPFLFEPIGPFGLLSAANMLNILISIAALGTFFWLKKVSIPFFIAGFILQVVGFLHGFITGISYYVLYSPLVGLVVVGVVIRLAIIYYAIHLKRKGILI